HQHDIGAQPASLADRFGAVRGLAHDLQAFLGVEHRGKALPNHRLVVGDEAPGAHAGCLDSSTMAAGAPSGSCTATTNPPPGWGPADSSPSSRATRSRMPASP